MTIRIIASAALAAALMSSAAYAASDYLLELDGVKGESGDGKGQIEISSYSWGASNPTNVGSSGMSAGRMAAAQPPSGPGTITVTTAGDAHCAKGNHFPQATIKARTGAYTLQDVTVTACDVHGDPHVQEMSYGKVSYSDLSVMSTAAPPKKGAK